MGTGFKNLKVWQESKRLAVDVYRLSESSGLAKDFGLRDQIRRAAVSVPSNIAEGDERDTDKDSVRFLYIAKGSLAELRTQLEIASEIGLITQVQFATLETDCLMIGKMLGALINSRRPIATRP
jgi:four helix bundle protein